MSSISAASASSIQATTAPPPPKPIALENFEKSASMQTRIGGQFRFALEEKDKFVEIAKGEGLGKAARELSDRVPISEEDAGQVIDYWSNGAGGVQAKDPFEGVQAGGGATAGIGGTAGAAQPAAQMVQQLQQLQSMVEGLMKQFGISSQQGAPQGQGCFSPAKIDPQAANDPTAVLMTLRLTINPPAAAPAQAAKSNAPIKDFGTLPESNGTPNSWGPQGQAMADRITGSQKSTFTYGPEGPFGQANQEAKTAISFAMFKNPNVKFDSDSKQFFTEGTDGSRHNVATLDEVMAEGRKNGGNTISNGAAISGINGFLTGRINAGGAPDSSAAGSADAATAAQGAGGQQAPQSLQQMMELLNTLMQSLQGQDLPRTRGPVWSEDPGPAAADPSQSTAGATNTPNAAQDAPQLQKMMGDIMQMFESIGKMLQQMTEMKQQQLPDVINTGIVTA